MNTTLWRLFNLRRDQDDPDAIDAEMRAGAQPVGANLWVLFFAILIASVGLNVNSTPVIVGAMLISPLMGPILAIGYAAAVHDLRLIREGARALGIFTGVSLVTSTLYFALSPLDQPGSELLARTSPTLWDVLIAAFGGAAGMIAATRKEVTNVLPGVAIATALMPPLCTAGFGLAHGRWDMFAGAAYLFVINGVFIAAATLAISKVLRLPRRGNVDPSTRRLHRIAIVTGIACVMAPSVWLGYRFVQQEVFSSGAARVAQQIESDPTFNLVSHQVDDKRRLLRLTLVGGFDETRLRSVVQALLQREGLGDTQIELRRAGDAPIDLGQLRSQFRADVDRTVLQQLQVSESKIRALEGNLQQLQAATAEAQSKAPPVDAQSLRQEVQAQLPQVATVTLAYGARATDGASTSADDTVVVVVETTRPLSAAQRSSLQRWLQVRLGQPEVQMLETRISKNGGRG
jgi:uncharacterized hydrophobic protein (TIGR00271 family)